MISQRTVRTETTAKLVSLADEISLSVWIAATKVSELQEITKLVRDVITDSKDEGLIAEFDNDIYNYNPESKVHEITQFYKVIVKR
nr:hypothetical protein [Xanthovirga aplysinae]